MKVAASADGGRRYALLLALNDSDYARKVYGGYYNVFVGALGSGESWDCFRVINGEFPAAEDLGRYDGFVVSGSPHDAYGDDLWIRRLCLLIQTLHALKKRILGICFGHQVLCRALGGKVGKSRSGWDVGVKKVTFVKNLEDFEFLGDLQELPQCASIIEVHQDEVWEIPPRAKVIAYSDKTSVEMFAVGDHVLGIQGHPEYGNDILLNLINRLVNNNNINRCVGEDARKTTESREPDCKFWTGLCKGFLRGGSGSGGGGRTVVHEPAVAAELSFSHVATRSGAAAAAPIGM